MGHSQADKARTHDRIVQIAAKRFREEGLDGIGVADLMKEAGLTVGGFYKHFGSREDLVAEAVASSLGAWQKQKDSLAAKGEELSFNQVVDEYLSPAHRDNPGEGCPFSALAEDLARSDAKTRALVTEQLRDNFDLIAGLLKNEKAGPARDKAILTCSALMGAVTLARVVEDDKLSREIMRSVAKSLKETAEG